jgi:mono/diheme cytochrome c family protein
LSLRFRVLLACTLTVALAAPVGYALAAREATPKVAAPTAAFMLEGRRLYKKYCGSCHALKVARAAGFGTETTEPGPSFNDVRVNWQRSINAVVLSIAGHESFSNKMSWKQISDVSRYLAIVTKKNRLAGTTAYG